jgi:large subunit ribosomal protein L21
MYAIVKTGGKQYRVERGQRLLIERLPAEEGADVALEPLLYRSEEAVFDKAGLDNVRGVFGCPVAGLTPHELLVRRPKGL